MPLTRILVVDDDEAMRLTLARILRDAGYEVEVASDGIQGLIEYRRHPPDLAIVDLIMPEKEGLETIVELRREFPTARVIAMTGYVGMQPLLKAARGFGAVGTIQKPFEAEDILSLIRKALRLA